MFSFFRSKPKNTPPPYHDVIWLNQKAKDTSLIVRLKTESETGVCLILSSFEESLNSFETKLRTVGLSPKRIDQLNQANAPHGIFTLHTKWIEAGTEVLTAHAQIFFLEHYPLPERDNKLLLQLEISIPEAPVFFYLALDEPIFDRFGGERLREIMQKMGMDEREQLEHSLITSSIRRAQEKLAGQVEREQKYDSEHEWYSKNLKP